MTVWGMRVLASLAGTRSASSLPFHWKITNLSFHSEPKEDCRNPNLDQEHEFSWGICGTDNSLRVKASVKATRPLVSFGSINQAIVQLAQVKQGQTRSNMAKQGQTWPNKVQQGQTRLNEVKWSHLFSSASCWWRCPMLRPCACCLQASICPENAKIFRVLFETFVTDLFLPHPFKFINEIGTVQVIPGLPGIILRLRCELNLLTTELKLCCKFHLIAKTTPLEEVLSLAIPPHPLINHLKRRRS